MLNDKYMILFRIILQIEEINESVFSDMYKLTEINYMEEKKWKQT